MKAKHLYLGLCVLGAALPYSQFLPFLREHGLDPRLIVEQLFANRISSFFGCSCHRRRNFCCHRGCRRMKSDRCWFSDELHLQQYCGS